MTTRTLGQADYVVTKSGSLGDELRNEKNRQVLERIVRSGFPYLRVARRPLPDGSELIISRARRLGGSYGVGSTRLVAPLPASARYDGVIAPASTGLECREETCVLTLGWRAVAPVGGDYKVFIHVYDALGRVEAVADYYPGAGRRPTSQWRPGEIVEDSVQLPGPPAYGRRVLVGWYRDAPRWRLPLSGASPAWKAEPHALEIHAAP
jgi:hypothetical protein